MIKHPFNLRGTRTGRIRGKCIKPARDQSDHTRGCPDCGQTYRMSHLAEVLHHEQPGHQPTN